MLQQKKFDKNLTNVSKCRRLKKAWRRLLYLKCHLACTYCMYLFLLLITVATIYIIVLTWWCCGRRMWTLPCWSSPRCTYTNTQSVSISSHTPCLFSFTTDIFSYFCAAVQSHLKHEAYCMLAGFTVYFQQWSVCSNHEYQSWPECAELRQLLGATFVLVELILIVDRRCCTSQFRTWQSTAAFVHCSWYSWQLISSVVCHSFLKKSSIVEKSQIRRYASNRLPADWISFPDRLDSWSWHHFSCKSQHRL